MWQMFTHTRCVCRTAWTWHGGAVQERRASFPAARDLQDTGIFGSVRAHTQESTLWQRRRGAGNDGGHHTASHVARERTTKVIPQIQCAPCHARSLSAHGIFAVATPFPTMGDPVCSSPRPTNPRPHGTKCALPPFGCPPREHRHHTSAARTRLQE